MTTDESPADSPIPETREAVFNLARAAEVAGVSPSTLRRNKALLRAHGATITDRGWQVPMSALIASGLMKRTTPPETSETAAAVPAEDDVHARLRELERELLEERHRRELAEERQRAAEAVAHERGEALEDVRTAMRMLTAGPSTPTQVRESATEILSANSPAAPDTTPQPEKTSWWKRLWG